MLTTQLKPFQSDTVKWMIDREASNTCGGLLLHEQGLGKTLCSIVVMIRDGLKPTLVICPSGIMCVWKTEILKHTSLKESDIVLYHGPKRNEKCTKVLTENKIYITSYSIVGIEYKKFLNDKVMDITLEPNHFLAQKFNRVVMDEVHWIRNRSSIASKGCMDLIKGNYFWLLTGTPIFNKMTDLYPYFHILGLEGVDDITEFRKLISCRTNMTSIRNAHKIIDKYALRYTKEEVLEDTLDPPDIQTVLLNFSRDEQTFYDALHEYSEVRIKNLTERVSKMGKSKLDTMLKQMMNMNVLTLILRLKQCCNSYQLVTNSMSRIKNQDLTEAIKTLTFYNKSKQYKDECPICLDKISNVILKPCGHKLCDSCYSHFDRLSINKCGVCRSKFKDIERLDRPLKNVSENSNVIEIFNSTKIKKLFELIDQENNQGRKVVVVSQWTGMLDLLKQILEQRDIEYLELSGRLSIDERHKNVDKFQRNLEIKVMLLSSNSSAEGVTLTAASTLVHMDIWWNKSKEEQVSARIHRIGQCNQVKIVHLYIENSLEQQIAKLVTKKGLIQETVLTKNEVRRVRVEKMGIVDQMIRILENTQINPKV